MNLVVPEVLSSVADLEQNRVGDCLARERSSRSSEGDGHPVLLGNGDHLSDLFLCVHLWVEKGGQTGYELGLGVS